MIQIGNVEVSGGEKQNLWLPVGNSGLSLPITVICGQQEGPTMLISAGVHGAEYIGIQAVMELSREVQPEQLQGNLICLLVANPSAAQQYVRFIVPEDGKNLNRVFPGKQDGTLSEQIAYWITNELQSQADYYIDVHAGDTCEEVMPFAYFTGVASTEVCRISESMAMATNMAVRVRSSAKTGAYSSGCLSGLPAILMERGGGGRFTWDELELYKQDLYNVLIHFGFLPGEERHSTSQERITQATYIEAENSGFWYPALSAGERFTQGTLLGEVKDVWGDLLHCYFGAYDGIVLYQTTSMGIQVGDPLIAYGLVEDSQRSS